VAIIQWSRACFGIILTLVSLSPIILVPSFTYAYDLYSRDDSPFGTPIDVWIGKWWNWWINTNSGGAAPESDKCNFTNSTSSMVMLMETTVNGKPHQVCNINSNQGIIVPLWTGFADASPGHTDDLGNPQDRSVWSYADLTKHAREALDLGAVTSLVKLDDKPIAKLDVVSSMDGNNLNYKVNSIKNVTEVFSKGFNITLPEDANVPDQTPGTWRAGAHGWFVFLKPLPPGDHTLYYNVGVTGTGPNDHSAEIAYTLHVK